MYLKSRIKKLLRVFFSHCWSSKCFQFILSLLDLLNKQSIKSDWNDAFQWCIFCCVLKENEAAILEKREEKMCWKANFDWERLRMTLNSRQNLKLLYYSSIKQTQQPFLPVIEIIILEIISFWNTSVLWIWGFLNGPFAIFS